MDREAEVSERALYEVGPEHDGLRAELFVALKVPFLSRGHLRRIIQTGGVRVNGHRLATSTRLRSRDSVEIRWRSATGAETAGAAVEPAVLYEDDHLLGLDKPAGLAVHPVGGRQAGTLIQAVRSRLAPAITAALERGDRGFYPRLVNRLDLFSSGIVLVAKDHETLVAMQRLMAARRVEKRYLVLVRGRMTAGRGAIASPIGPMEGGAVAVRRVVRPDGLPALTEYEVRELLSEATLLWAWPRTGRQHQIRVHFASMGHPVWGDLIYADEALFLRYWANGCRLDEGLPRRHALHAEHVAFAHPATGRRTEITAPAPPDFARMVDDLRSGPQAQAPPPSLQIGAFASSSHSCSGSKILESGPKRAS